METLYKLFLTILLLITLSACSDKKSNDTESNPFGSTDNNESNILQPCNWTFTVEESANDEVILISTAKIDSAWHLYSQLIPDKHVRTEFAYESSHNYSLLGNTDEGESHKEYDPYLEMEVLYFERKAEFKQKIKVLSKTGFTIKGTIDYMVCNTQCVSLDEEFSFTVKGNPDGV
ncbi:MAG: protein-disulfide reductase DsbD domain-containing protein [Bacteroidota bacterium]